MSTLLQSLITFTALASLYAVVIHNPKEVKELIALLPDLRKLVPEKVSRQVKLVVFVPDSKAEAVRKAIAEAGGGIMGHYTCMSFSSQGIGRYQPEPGANPVIGEVGKLQLVEQERIEATISREILPQVLEALAHIHPYEETIIDIYPLEDMPLAAPAQASHHGGHGH